MKIEHALAKPESPAALNGLWILQDITDSIGVKKGTFIKISDDSYYLYAGCNHINGGLSVTKNAVTSSIQFMEGMSTMMACTNMNYERQLKNILLTVNAYRLVNNQLILTTKTGKILTFKQQTPAEHLTGKAFTLAALTINNGVVYTADAPLQTMVFSEKGRLSGNAGCNTYTATYRIDGEQLHISKVVSTKKACKEAKKKEYESVFYKHLQKTPLTIEDSPQGVTLRDKQGSTVMVLRGN